ncbi:hypothetical protein RDI58_010443 [Solanum bulbocastanum]|uniref:DUF4283 domain-containing protein n=1 Tax=Solanum bulbocastanum TaxID=147425 RepID=A0AAN8TUB6_SOLBU
MGKRAWIPTLKAAMAMESTTQVAGKQKKKGHQASLVQEASSEPNEAAEGIKQHNKQSWADEVEAMQEVQRRPSVWETFDINKVSNAGFQLEFVAPEIQGKSVECEIGIEDISSEIAYWRNSVVCYVLGAHPPFSILNGYVQRLWGKHGINKVHMLKNGIVLVRFDSCWE